MHCYVYASQHKRDTYVWLLARDDFTVLPEALALLLGDLRFVLEVDLDERRQLPHEDSRLVLAHLREQPHVGVALVLTCIDVAMHGG